MSLCACVALSEATRWLLCKTENDKEEEEEGTEATRHCNRMYMHMYIRSNVEVLMRPAMWRY